MLPTWIIKPIDVLEYGTLSLPSGFPSGAPDPLCLEISEEGLDHRIIATVSHANSSFVSHRGVINPNLYVVTNGGFVDAMLH